MKSNKRRNAIIIIGVVIICCILMALIETVIEPVYFVKSLMKIIIFLLLPIVTMKLLKIKIFKQSNLDKKKIVKLLIIGIVIYSLIMISYTIINKFFDCSALISSLSTDQKVNNKDFIFVAIYISLCNSLLEEFLFRYVSFIKLSELLSKRIAYIISSILFAIYHISMFGSSFPLPLVLLMVFGLFIGGYIFDYVDEKDKNIYNSWIIHMFADFAIMTIWFINI